MARVSLESLDLLTHGNISACKNEMKQIFCHDKFPKCLDIRKLVSWENSTYKCQSLVKKCPKEVQEIFRNLRLCDNLSNGRRVLDKCKIFLFSYNAHVFVNSFIINLPMNLGIKAMATGPLRASLRVLPDFGEYSYIQSTIESYIFTANLRRFVYWRSVYCLLVVTIVRPK